MSGSGPDHSPFAEFIDDYFAECDEHLGIVRRGLLTLEAEVNRPELNRPLLDELFRSFHTIKGLSGMVGVREAEDVAHLLESYLSALRQSQVRLTPRGMEVLFQGVKLLEQAIAARRTQTPPPIVEEFREQVTDLIPEMNSAPVEVPEPPEETTQPAPELDPQKQQTLRAALASGASAWRFLFIPSAEASEQGVNVNSVRQRLQELGELLQAAPVIREGGQIAFSFILLSHATEEELDAWADRGLTRTPYVAEDSASTPPEDDRPAPSKAGAGSTMSAALTPANVVRVDLARLDELMRMVGDLVISRSRLQEGLSRIEGSVPRADFRMLQETNQTLERQLRDLREGVMRVRLVPIREVFARMQFVVRDLTREYGKQVTLELQGQETEIDKFVVERILDPLLHLVRNAVSHGLESPDERSVQGKPVEGRLSLRAIPTGELIQIEVEDDGRGIDADSVFARAKALGLSSETEHRDSSSLLDILCASGFSTREEADRASGRGMGMDVVRRIIDELGGTLELETWPGAGTRFLIQLPLTLAIADSLVIEVSDQHFAVPQSSVREVLQLPTDSTTRLEGNELIPYRDGVLPVIRLATLFGLPTRESQMLYALVLGTGRSAVAIVVDRVIGQREIVVRPLNDPFVRVPGIAGATELGDGRVVLILDIPSLTRNARKKAEETAAERERDAGRTSR